MDHQLGQEDHRLLQRAGIVGPRERFVHREVYDYGHVLHDLQLNAWCCPACFRGAAEARVARRPLYPRAVVAGE
jgi:hypothetical protein